MGKRKISKRVTAFLVLTGIYAALAFSIVFPIVFIINASIVMKSSAANAVAKTGAAEQTNGSPNIPSGAVNIGFSYDDQYFCYLYRNALYVKTIQTGALVKQISADGGIKKAILMNNRDIILYFSIDSGGHLNISTFSIENGSTSLQKTIPLPAGASIGQADYSSNTSLVYFDVETAGGGTAKDTLYYLDIMKNLKQLPTTERITQMVLLNNTNALYLEDANSNISLNSHSLPNFKNQRMQLLGCDQADNIYIQPVSDKHTIYVFDSPNTVKSIHLNTSGYSQLYSDKIGIYAVYANYLIDLAADPTKKLNFNSELKFAGVGGSKVYFTDKNGNVTSQNNTLHS